eukprot:CAMPEP_0175811698 /NCGR_PEP_ID=MMETSP0107_2-20121207/3985_1 /TAXON_ID=195067 ORGANISM="Goniomonas pacifica, Strain CCMP1869" /NCGR_SAMPLE_ID=MMETSP0107_2 /ASSEMBLY_ACC=CAM_ASM_000203 /LENGTH=140 /DNA_ID=CAMNT_0017123517 /DNA_START=674 /DNA_END=1093 /DNA_ORIENTATION=+
MIPQLALVVLVLAWTQRRENVWVSFPLSRGAAIASGDACKLRWELAEFVYARLKLDPVHRSLHSLWFFVPSAASARLRKLPPHGAHSRLRPFRPLRWLCGGRRLAAVSLNTHKGFLAIGHPRDRFLLLHLGSDVVVVGSD